MKAIKIILIFLVSLENHAQFNACQFQEDYRNSLKLDTEYAVDKEYKSIFKIDQNNRGPKQDKFLDLRNVLKLGVLIGEYGLAKNTLDTEISNSINVVFSHNSFSKYFYQELLKRYENEEVTEIDMNFRLLKIFRQSFNFMFCETKENSILEENSLMISHLQFLQKQNFNISNLCEAINANLKQERDTKLMKVYEWEDKSACFQIVSSSNSFLLRTKYPQSTVNTYLLKKVDENLFVYDNPYTKTQYKFDENRVEIINKYCDSEEKKYHYKLK